MKIKHTVVLSISREIDVTVPDMADDDQVVEAAQRAVTDISCALERDGWQVSTENVEELEESEDDEDFDEDDDEEE